MFPFIERIGEMGITNLYKDRNCQQRLFCDMAQYGKDESAIKQPNMIQKMFSMMSQM